MTQHKFLSLDAPSQASSYTSLLSLFLFRPSESLAVSFLCPTLSPIYQTSTGTYISSSEQKCTCLPSWDLSFSHHATLLSVLFWMVEFPVSSNPLHNSLCLSLRIPPSDGSLSAGPDWIVRCSGFKIKSPCLTKHDTMKTSIA